MARVTESIDVAEPVRTADNQWTQFEEFPKFMEGVKEVRQLDDVRTNGRRGGGQREKWEAEITEQCPDELVAWRSISGTTNAGVVPFHRPGDARRASPWRNETEGLPRGWSRRWAPVE